MKKIQCLDAHVADLIAAGEVVERPGAAVKELMENAIDAGATAITVEIVRGGMQLIRVTDNGSGIAEEDVKTAFLRHATSKIRTEHDLESIGTLGFRGEALAAIAAVSRVEIRTRTAQSDVGTLLTLEGGVPGELLPVGVPQGTTIWVRDLFYNTPARQKYIKIDSAEGMHVFAQVQRIALSHPEISFCFLREGKEELRTPGDSLLQSAVYTVLGREVALHLCPVRGEWENCAINGFVSQPSHCKGTRNQQYFFVNGRFVKSRVLMAALEEAYKNQSMVGKFPACVLQITMPLSMVDVNVHPTKTEVKFAKERQMFDLVYQSVSSALEHGTAYPRMQFHQNALAEAEQTVSEKKQQQTERHSKTELGTAAKAQVESDWDRVADELRVPYQGASFGLAASSAEKPVLQYQIRLPQETHREAAVKYPLEKPLSDSKREKQNQKCVEEKTEETTSFRLVGEVFHTYLIVETEEKMLLIDKHAAHERMQFDRMKAEGYQPMSQTLLQPIVITAREELGDVLLQNIELLAQFGFEVEAFGGESLLVRSIPFDLEPNQTENTLLALAEELLHGQRADPQGVRDQLLRTMACKLAIKSGQDNTPEELMIVAEAVVSGAIKYCPHGRPVAIVVESRDLEKQLKRT